MCVGNEWGRSETRNITSHASIKMIWCKNPSADMWVRLDFLASHRIESSLGIRITLIVYPFLLSSSSSSSSYSKCLLGENALCDLWQISKPLCTRAHTERQIPDIKVIEGVNNRLAWRACVLLCWWRIRWARSWLKLAEGLNIVQKISLEILACLLMKNFICSLISSISKLDRHFKLCFE